MEINDKRKFNADGDTIVAIAETPIDYRNVLSDIPRVYDDPSPMSNHVLVKQAAAETTYAGTKFVIPDTARQSPNEGVVVAVGPKVDPSELVPGDLVTFGRYNAEPITVSGEDFVLVSFHDIKLRQKVTFASR